MSQDRGGAIGGNGRPIGNVGGGGGGYTTYYGGGYGCGKTWSEHMTQAEVDAAVERVVAFLEDCGIADIEAGIGALEGVGTERAILDFKAELAKAIRGQ